MPAIYQIIKSKEPAKVYLLIYVTVMYRCTKFVILNFSTYDIFSFLDKDSKNLFKSMKESN